MKLIEIKKLRISVHPLFLVLSVIMIALGYIEQFFILLLITTIHEFAHIIVAIIFGSKLVKVIIYPIGEMAVLDNMFIITPLKKFLIICSGPFINILLGIIFARLGDKDIFKFISLSNFSIGIFNIIPIYPLDGGRIFHLFLSNSIGILNANDTILKISKLFIIIIFLLGIFQVILYPYNVSLICIAVYLNNTIKKEEFNLSLDFFRNISAKSEIINKYGFIHTNIITIFEDTYIRDILRYIKSNSLCRLCVIDRKLNFVGYINESQIIDFIMEYGTKINLKDTKWAISK